jgi:hypothetical protein
MLVQWLKLAKRARTSLICQDQAILLQSWAKKGKRATSGECNGSKS